jgi:hypothetical protein
LIARPLSVHSALGKRKTSTPVKPFLTARWTISAARLSASYSEMPEGFNSLSINAFFSACLLLLAQRLARHLGLGKGRHLHRLLRGRQWIR